MNDTTEPQPHPKLDASCRMALAAYLHDLGKFAERARIAEAETKDEDGNRRIDLHKQLYCPQFDGRYTHVHAAYTAIGIDLLEPWLPELVGTEVTPFVAWKDPETDDSLINAAARHHRPETYLQWIIATADRVASGFEREAFEHYNRADEETETGRDHYTARLLTLFEQIRLDGQGPTSKAGFRYRYPLRPMSANALFPKPASECEPSQRKAGQAEYADLWKGFLDDVQRIPASHRDNWSLWLDHFDALWATYTHAIPAATAGGVRPEVSLYDHARTAAALATALWRYHDDRGDDPRAVARAQAERADWDDNKFLLILGDFFGIQEFIFATGGETQKNAARLLRGRSFQVSLLTECAALRILDTLGLPPTSQVINAAGKLLIVAPATSESEAALSRLQQEFDDWFMAQTYGAAGIGLTWEPASCNDFLVREGDTPPFGRLIGRLFARMDTMKNQRLGLCREAAPASVMSDFWERFDPALGVCAVDGRTPAAEPLDKSPDRHVSSLAADQIRIGKWLAHHDRLLVTTEPLAGADSLALDLLGYRITFTDEAAASGHFGKLARRGVLRRAWDYALPESAGETLFRGYAWRHINAHVPLFGEPTPVDRLRYRKLAEETPDPRAPKTFEHIALDDLYPDERGELLGSEGLMTIKGDVDNLGLIFEAGLARPSFAKWASLSRQMNAFFAVVLPSLCRKEYPDTYTVFAGGDDFFLIGPWYRTLALARTMRRLFDDYVAANPDLHFSAGLVMSKPGLPVRQLGELAEEALEAAKTRPDKNAVTVFGETTVWDEFEHLWNVYESIEEASAAHGLATGYLYRLQTLAAMADNLQSAEADARNAIWYSWFSYRTWRMLERVPGLSRAERERRMEELSKILMEPIRDYGNRFRIPLFTYLYRHRR